jgi:hypothetical protein
MSQELTAAKRQVEVLHLIISLLKDGCEWQGDIVSRKYVEMLVIPDDEHVRERVKATIDCYTEEDYKLEVDAEGKMASIWIKE